MDPKTVLVVNGGILHARFAFSEQSAQKIWGQSAAVSTLRFHHHHKINFFPVSYGSLCFMSTAASDHVGYEWFYRYGRTENVPGHASAFDVSAP